MLTGVDCAARGAAGAGETMIVCWVAGATAVGAVAVVVGVVEVAVATKVVELLVGGKRAAESGESRMDCTDWLVELDWLGTDWLGTDWLGTDWAGCATETGGEGK